MGMNMNVHSGDELQYDLRGMLDLIGKFGLGFVVELRNAETFHDYG